MIDLVSTMGKTISSYDMKNIDESKELKLTTDDLIKYSQEYAFNQCLNIDNPAMAVQVFMDSYKIFNGTIICFFDIIWKITSW